MWTKQKRFNVKLTFFLGYICVTDRLKIEEGLFFIRRLFSNWIQSIIDWYHKQFYINQIFLATLSVSFQFLIYEVHIFLYIRMQYKYF